jgi:hypothetical protein
MECDVDHEWYVDKNLEGGDREKYIEKEKVK